jgi:hypothetical protein
MIDGQRHLELDTVTLLENSEFGHIDRQVCNLIDDVELFVKNEFEIELPKKVDMFGYSGEGDFIVRFALLHPQYLHAVCAGGTSWSPSVALETLNGEALKYPLGLSGIELYSEDFNLEEWKSIHFFIDIGIHDDRGSYNRKQLKSMEWSKNLSFQQVYDVFCNAFVNLTDNAEMVLYYSLGHEYNSNDYVSFLKLNDGEEFVSIETSTSARVITSSGTVEYKSKESGNLHLVLDDVVLGDGTGFGRGKNEFTLQVIYGSDPIKDYSFELSDSSYGTVEKDAEGVLHLHTAHPNSTGTTLTVTAEGSVITCRWNDPNWLHLVLDGKTIKNGNCFGRGNKEFTLQVYCGPDPIKDYSFELSDPSYGTVEKEADGVLHLHTTNPNPTGTDLTVTAEGSVMTCKWYDPD